MEWVVLILVILALRTWFRARSRAGGFGRDNAQAFGQAFAYAALKLGARVAKADGRITPDEIQAFKRAFPVEDLVPDAGAVFNAAANDPRPVEEIAEEARLALGPGNRRMFLLLIMGLARVAAADGALAEAELETLVRIGAVLGLEPRMVAALAFAAAGGPQAFAGSAGGAGRRYAAAPVDERQRARDLLGVEEGASRATIRNAWRKLAKEHHPDALRARGAPEAAIRDAEAYMQALNAAYETLTKA